MPGKPKVARGAISITFFRELQARVADTTLATCTAGLADLLSPVSQPERPDIL